MRLGWRVSRRRRRIRGGLCTSHRGNCKGKRKRKMSEGRRGRLDCERRMKNERTKVRCDESKGRRSPKLRKGRRRRNNPQRMHQTVNGWCESVKMQQISTEVKEVPFDDQINVEGSWGLRESKSVVGLQKKTQSISKAGRWWNSKNEMGLRVFQTIFGSVNDS